MLNNVSNYQLFVNIKGAKMKLAVNFWQNVKKANRNFLPVLLGLVLLTTAVAAKIPAHATHEIGTTTNTQLNVEPSATFGRIWVDYGVTEGSEKGMRVHVKFSVYNMKGMPGYLAIYFQDDAGTPLEDTNGKYDSSDGKVAVYFEINPCCQSTEYADVAVFMPYSELDLDGGEYNLKMDVDVIYKEGGVIGHLTLYDFQYSQPLPPPGAIFDKVWVDYDVTQAGQRGMRVHVKFTTVSLKGINGRLAVFFQKEGGGKLITSSPAYRSKDSGRVGELVAYYDILPGYQRTIYEDATVFLPYDQLKLVLPRGNHSLQMDIDVVYKNGTLVEHLMTEEFWFDRK